MEGPAGPRGQKGESGSVGEGYQFLSRDEVTARCADEACYDEVGSQAISYTTGVPAMIGALLMLQKKWFRPGVWNVEQFNPDLESFRRPLLGTQGPVSGQSRISETGTTTAY